MNNWFFFVLPIISVYITSYFFPVNDAGNNVSFRPPGYVFAIVWPILLVLIGTSWLKINNRNNKLSFLEKLNKVYINKFYFFIVILLSSWSMLYSFSRVYGLIVIVFTIIASIFTIYYNYNNNYKYSAYLLIPLVLWLLFASLLNIASIS